MNTDELTKLRAEAEEAHDNVERLTEMVEKLRAERDKLRAEVGALRDVERAARPFIHESSMAARCLTERLARLDALRKEKPHQAQDCSRATGSQPPQHAPRPRPPLQGGAVMADMDRCEKHGTEFPAEHGYCGVCANEEHAAYYNGIRATERARIVALLRREAEKLVAADKIASQFATAAPGNNHINLDVAWSFRDLADRIEMGE